MKNTVLGMAALGLVLTMMAAGGQVFGQEARGARERGARSVDAPRGGNLTGRIARLLDMTDAQRESTRTLVDDHLEAIQPLRERAAEARQSIRGQLESDADATAIGNAVLSAREVGAELRAANEGLREALRETLTPEQQERLDGIRNLLAPIDDDTRAGGRGRIARRAR